MTEQKIEMGPKETLDHALKMDSAKKLREKKKYNNNVDRVERQNWAISRCIVSSYSKRYSENYESIDWS